MALRNSFAFFKTAHSVRYLCTSRLSTECLSYLSIHQKRIKDLHVPGQVPLELIVPPLVNLTLGFTYTNEKTEMVLSLMDVLPSLNSLCLAIKSGWTSPVEQFWTLSNKETAEAKKKRTKIRATALILTGFMPPSFSSSFDTIFDLSLVTQLILRDCTLHYVAALKGMENLTRFELNCYEQVDEEHCENLLDFCEQSPKLNDLRLITRFSTGWYDDNSIDHLPSYVQELPRNVSVLVLHDSYLTDVGRLNSSMTFFPLRSIFTK